MISSIEALLRSPTGGTNGGIIVTAFGSNVASATVKYITRNGPVQPSLAVMPQNQEPFLTAASRANILRSIAEHARGENSVLSLESLETDDE